MRPLSVLCSLVRTAAILSVVLILCLIVYYSAIASDGQPQSHVRQPTIATTASVELKVGYHRLLQTAVRASDTTSSPRKITSTALHTAIPTNITSQQNVAASWKDRYDKPEKEVLQSSIPSRLDSFQMSSDFHWPQPRAVKAMKELKREKWLADLQNCLQKLLSNEVVLLTSNQPYTEVLLNWLIAAVTRASFDLSQVLVISMDSGLHSLLDARGIFSVLIRPQSLLTTAAVKEGIFPTVMMTRLSLIRLLNHWGYDVMNFDTDAVLLRDPFPLLKSSNDIIGTFGKFPTDLTKRWGITLCTALLVVRSSPVTEKFWEAVSRVALSSFSDQGKVNYGLQALGVKWALPSRNLGSLSHSVQGECRNGLQVCLLPHNIACRAGSCTHKALSAGLYIWHKGGARARDKKREGAQEGGVWYLRSNWNVGCDGKLGRNWLQCISTHSL